MRFATSYVDNLLEDFTFLHGVSLGTHCSITNVSLPGNTKDQGSMCGNYQSRYAFEPSVNANYQALPWLSFYGGYSETLRSPSLGGGGLFQSVDPYTYHLSERPLWPV